MAGRELDGVKGKDARALSPSSGFSGSVGQRPVDVVSPTYKFAVIDT